MTRPMVRKMVVDRIKSRITRALNFRSIWMSKRDMQLARLKARENKSGRKNPVAGEMEKGEVMFSSTL